MSKKDTDKDGWIDSQDPEPTNPLVPARGDTTGIVGALQQSGIPIGSYGGGGITYIDTTGMGSETARETRAAYRGNPNYTTDKAVADASKIQPPPPGSGNAGVYRGPVTSTQKQVTTYTLQEVKGLANQAFQAAIGREATKEELSRFLENLNKEEKANPTKTVSTSTPHGHNVSTSQKSSGGVDEQQYAADQARLSPEYAGYQQATTYFNAMLSTLSGTVGRGA